MSELPTWLPPLPSEWKVVPLRYVSDVATGDADTVEAEPEGEFPFVVRSPTLQRINRFTHDCEAILTPGDGDVGEVFHHLHGRFAAHQRVYVLFNFRGIQERYFYYYFSENFRNVTESGTAKSTVESLRRPMFMSFPVVVPPIQTQKEITDFLDRESAKIDTLITKQQRLISALSERRAALLLRATMEPEHDWPQVRIGHVLRKLERQPSDVAVVVTAYRDGQVTSRANRRDDGYTISFTEKDYQRVHAGDLVFHALDGFAGAVGVSDSDGKCTPVYHVCEPLVGSDANYLAFHLRALGQAGFLTAFAWNVRQRSVDYRNWTLFASLPICVPRPDRQSEIATKLAQETAKIDRLVEKARELIAVMKERRAALISATVTGQIDVTTYGNGD